MGFVTAVEIGAACIEEIYELGGRLDLIVTLKDDTDRNKTGRVNLSGLARRHGCRLVQVRNINDSDTVAELEAAELDWLFIVGWSQIASPTVLAAPSMGAIGAHPTLLPVGRGRAPIPWTILKSLPESGVTFFLLDEGVDSGPIIAQQTFSVDPSDDATSLYARVVQTHRSLIRYLWPLLQKGSPNTYRQDDARATYWEKRSPQDSEISPGMTKEEIDRLVRAVTHPYPGAFFVVDESVVRIWRGTSATPCIAQRAYAIMAIDGTWWATDFEFESKEPQPSN